MPTITSAGAEIFYHDLGAGLPVLLLHAFPLDAQTFFPQADVLSRRFRFILPDHRGFGRSRLPPGATVSEMHQLADDAVAVLDALGLETAVIGGVSMGGYAAMALLRRHAERARALVLIDTQLGPDDPTAKARREALATATAGEGMQPVIDAVFPRLLRPTAPAALRSQIEATIRGTDPRAAAAALRGMGVRQDSRDVLARYRRPTLVVVGAEDAITGPDKARDIADTISEARLITLAQAGHLANQEAPQEFNRAIESFLETLG